MAELHSELNSHFDLHKIALTVAPNSGRAAGEFWAAILEPDKNVSNLSSEDFHWFKVKGKHTVAKVQKAYHKKCGVTILLRQGDRVIPSTTQMQQINHFKDDIIIFSSKSTSEDDNADLSRTPLQSIDAASQNRMQTPSRTPVKAETGSASRPVKMKAEPDLSTVSPSPFKTPAISRTLPEAGTPASSGSSSRLGQLDIPAPAPTTGYDVFAVSQRDYHRNSKLTAAGLDTSLRDAWTVLTPTSREFWERKATNHANNIPASVNASAPNALLGYESFAEVHRANYTSSSATPAEIESSLRKIWDKMSSDTREYYSTKDAQKSNTPVSNNSLLLPAPAVDTKPLPGSFSLSSNNRSRSVTKDDLVMKPDDYSSAFKDEGGSPEPEPQTLELAKLRLQHIMEDGSPEILEQEVKKTNDFLDALKNHFKVPEAESHPDTSHWLQQIDTLQAQVVNTPTIIGVVGNTGAGKSSVINAMLDEERLVPTNCMRACTAVVTEMSWNFSDDPSKKYRAEIEFIKESDWEKDLKVSLNELIDASGNVSRDSTNADTEAGIAYAKIKAVYPNKTHEMLANSTAEELLAEGDVRTVLGTTRTIEKSYPEFFYKELQRYVDSKEKSTGEKGRPSEKKKEKRTMEFWPLIKVVRIFVKADALSTGAVIVDLPGVHDSNAARAAVAAGYMKQCTGLWVCAPINRAVDDKAAKSLLGESFKRQLKYDGQFSRITFICSKTDDISVLEASDSLGLEDAMAEDYAMIDQIDKQVDELNAKIADLKEKIDVYSGVYNDADESLDIWDDLRRDIDAGEAVYVPKAAPEKSPKRKRSPSSSKSRKKMKISENEDDDDSINDDDEDQEDDELSDDETDAEAEEEDLDKGDPLKIEDIEQKIDDLKDTKKQARKEKAALELEIKEVKKQSKELNQQRKEIDTRMRAICIDGRNKYSKGAIQQDFAAGIKELDMENAEEEDAENFNPDEDMRDYDAVARSLPVFCVSSRAYQQLNGRLRKDAKIPGFRAIEETQIPQLQAHCKKLTEAGRSATCRRFLNALLQLVLSLSLWSNNDGTNINLSDSQKMAQASWLQKNLKELERSLDGAVGSCVADMNDALTENIFEKFSEAIPLAAEQAPSIAAKWGAPVNKVDRAAGGLYFQTYRAVIRRDGVYGNKNAAYNFNSDLTEPIMKHLANHWEKNFSRRIPSVLRSFTTKTNLILKNFHQAVESRSRKNGTGIAGLVMLAQQLRTYESSFSILNIEMIEAINSLQRDANREFVPVIAQNLVSSYHHCAGESGVGMYKRIKDHLGNEIQQKRNSMFKESCDEVKTRLNKMCRQVEESMNNKTDEVFLLMRRDYLQVLNGAQVSVDVMPKWERHMRSQISLVLATFDKDEGEKIATGVKDEVIEDEIFKDTKAEDLDSIKKDGSAEASAVQDNEVEVDAMGLEEANAPTVKSEQFTDDRTDDSKAPEIREADTNASSSVMGVHGPATEASPSDLPSTDILA